VSDDPQDVAESLDEDRMNDFDDRAGDWVGEALPGYPPDRPLGAEATGVTPIEEDGGESFAERAGRDVRDESDAARAEGVGQLVEPAASTEDREEHQIAEAVPGTMLDPEEDAMHVTDDVD
jgi:hypothetical protein